MQEANIALSRPLIHFLTLLLSFISPTFVSSAFTFLIAGAFATSPSHPVAVQQLRTFHVQIFPLDPAARAHITTNVLATSSVRGIIKSPPSEDLTQL